MKARDASKITPLIAPEIDSFAVRDKAPVSRLIPATKTQSVTGNKRTRKPPSQKAAKPPSVTGYFWRKDGAGWELRKDIYVTGNNGEKKRKQPYIAHMSREAYGELKRKHKGQGLEKAIQEWIAEHDR